VAIIKILSRHSPSYSSLINYILNESKIDKSQVYTHNMRSNDIKGYIQDFIGNEAVRKQFRSDQVFMYHEIFSFNASENNAALTRDVIDNLIQEYIRLRGHAGVILAAPHFDKEHVHVHFCVSALQYRTGKSFGLSKAQLRELKVSFQQYHKLHFPEIEKSFPEHGKGSRYVSHAKWHREQREKIVDTIRRCFALATSQQHFLNLLREQDLHYYERNGKATGIEHDGLKFRFSRLLEEKQFESLAVDKTEEEKTLAEIQSIRNRQQDLDRDNREEIERAR
jgi:hypothetical protein